MCSSCKKEKFGSWEEKKKDCEYISLKNDVVAVRLLPSLEKNLLFVAAKFVVV